MRLPLAAGQKVFRGGMACLDTSANVVKKGAGGNANLVRIGVFAEDVDNSAGGSSVLVDVKLDNEIFVQWFDNSGTNPVTTLFSTAYIEDDHTVGSLSTGNSIAGRVWAIDAVKGVAVGHEITGGP